MAYATVSPHVYVGPTQRGSKTMVYAHRADTYSAALSIVQDLEHVRTPH